MSEETDHANVALVPDALRAWHVRVGSRRLRPRAIRTSVWPCQKYHRIARMIGEQPRHRARCAVGLTLGVRDSST